MKQSIAEFAASIKDLQISIAKSVPFTLFFRIVSFLDWLSRTIDEISITLVKWWYQAK